MRFNALALLSLNLVLFLPVEAAPEQNIAAELNGKLVALRGKSALPCAAPDLPQAKYIALYFSAGWCGPNSQPSHPPASVRPSTQFFARTST